MYQAEGNLLEDEVLIDTLAASKKTSIEIATKLEEAVATEKTLDAVRVLYAPVAQRLTLFVFFVFCCTY
jgi:dynein heavy chain